MTSMAFTRGNPDRPVVVSSNDEGFVHLGVRVSTGHPLEEINVAVNGISPIEAGGILPGSS